MQNKFDLSIDVAELDYQELIKTAWIAMHYSLDSLEVRLRTWHVAGEIPIDVDAEWMRRDAINLATATICAYYLAEAKSRYEIKLVNVSEKGD